jgi:orotidine-5'-phosphate decarboxylase
VGLSREAALARLVVALDVSDEERIVELAAALAGHVGMAKIGLEAFTALGPRIVARMRELGLPVFLDLKLHDIPTTVERAAGNCARLGVRLFTVHAGGGEAMLAAAAAGAAGGTPAGDPPPAALAVTVLTSLDEASLAALDMPGSAAGRVMTWAALAERNGCGGVVCSPREVAALRAVRRPGFILLAPGIRPAGAASGDQKRVATPASAVADGADFIVVGRPITTAPDPVAAAESIVEELCRA